MGMALKIESIKVLDDGMNEAMANALFDKLELYASYQFNKSHAVEYTIISMWTQYLRVHYPHAFYAAALEVFKEEKLQGLVTDAAKRGIELLPPDINESTSEFRRLGDHLLMPLNRIKGVGEPTEAAILAAREKVGKFTSPEHLAANVERRKCNVRHMKVLEEIGAFAALVPGSLPARHPDRVKIQKELLPGLVIQAVRADRHIIIDEHSQAKLTALYMELREQGAIVLPRFGKKPKIAVVFEAPNWQDEKKGKLMETENAAFVKEAIKAVGLSMADCYFTAMLKKPKEGKTATNDEVLFSRPFFAREMEILKPPVIVALGSFVTKELLPDLKGGVIELNGRVEFDKIRDASVVVAISPGQVWHDPGKQEMLNQAFAQAAELLS
jgi:DNA polymerase-3 subunit alpha